MTGAMIKHLLEYLGVKTVQQYRSEDLHPKVVLNEELLVIVQKLPEDRVDELLSKKYQHKYWWHMTVVTACMLDYTDLFVLIDRLQIPKKFGGVAAVVEELYKACVKINPELGNRDGSEQDETGSPTQDSAATEEIQSGRGVLAI